MKSNLTSILQEGPLSTSVLFTLAITVPEIMENIQSDVQRCALGCSSRGTFLKPLEKLTFGAPWQGWRIRILREREHPLWTQVHPSLPKAPLKRRDSSNMLSAGAKPTHSWIQPPQWSEKSATVGARATGDRRVENKKKHTSHLVRQEWMK